MKTPLQAMLLATAATFGVLACSLEPPGRESKIHLDLTPLTEAYREASLGLPFVAPLADTIFSAPATLADFQCYGVNVLGPGIPDSSLSPSRNLGPIHQKLVSGESACGYRGIVSSTITSAASPTSVELQVPTGPSRVVQVWGVANAAACANGLQASFAGGPLSIEAYELGKAVVNLYGDRAVSIPIAYDVSLAESKRVDCDQCAIFAQFTPSPNATPSVASPSFTKVAVRVTLSSARVIGKARLAMSAGSSASVAMSIHPDNGANEPNLGSTLATSVPSTVPSGPGAFPVTFEFRDGVTPLGVPLTAGIYWLVMAIPASSSLTLQASTSALAGSPAALRYATSTWSGFQNEVTYALSSCGD